MVSDRRPEEVDLPGQGEKLPDGLPYSGQWIWLNELFLFWPRPGDHIEGTVMTAAMQVDGDRWCRGVNAELLASRFRLDIGSVFAANRDRMLYVAARIDAPRHGGKSAITYRFRIASGELALTFEDGLPGGRA